MEQLIVCNKMLPKGVKCDELFLTGKYDSMNTEFNSTLSKKTKYSY